MRAQPDAAFAARSAAGASLVAALSIVWIQASTSASPGPTPARSQDETTSAKASPASTTSAFVPPYADVRLDMFCSLLEFIGTLFQERQFLTRHRQCSYDSFGRNLHPLAGFFRNVHFDLSRP